MWTDKYAHFTSTSACQAIRSSGFSLTVQGIYFSSVRRLSADLLEQGMIQSPAR